jgi:tryptophan 2,3-dioxygenase
MIEYDELFGLWREHHIRMAERMIGQKPGTGQAAGAYALGQAGPLGTHGVGYLRTTLGKRFFPVLWDARTVM